MDSLPKRVRQIGRERHIPAAVVERALDAIGLQDSPKYTTPSGATLTLLTDLARTNPLRDLNLVVEMFALAHPGNARFVTENVPVKVLNHYIAHRLDFHGTERILKWQAMHPDWTDEVQVALANFALDIWAETAVKEMQAIPLN
ncbi:UNVERIFIED_ORG: hypothetical protein J2Y81_008092 [Paraburkholderia sediminicola]|nr:hypothetical protein [Paraburkholderia sediminicola]